MAAPQPAEKLLLGRKQAKKLPGFAPRVVTAGEHLLHPTKVWGGPFPRHCPPEVAGGGHLAQEDGEAGEDGAVAGAGGVELQQSMEVAAQEVEAGGGQVAAGLHGAPSPLGDVQQQLQLRRCPVQLLRQPRRSLGRRRKKGVRMGRDGGRGAGEGVG